MNNKNLGPLMIDINGLELTQEDKEILQHPAVGGVIIFSRNFSSIEQITALNNQIKNLATKNKSSNNDLLISVDQEGGTVQRIKEPLTILPSMQDLGKFYEYDAKAAINLAKQLGWLLASELLAIGFDFSFTPVVDLNLCDNKIVKLRSFHKKANIVSELALALKKGLNQAGMAAVAKHFPGHGGVHEDSHEATPIDTRAYNELDDHDLQPYKYLINHDLEAIMTSHIVFPNIDKNLVSFSKFWLQDILREKLGFNGLIISDDLNMNGADFSIDNHVSNVITLDHTQRVHKALDAGCELILLCNNRKAVISTLDNWGSFKWQDEQNLFSNKLNRMRASGEGLQSLAYLHRQDAWRYIKNNIDKLAVNA